MKELELALAEDCSPSKVYGICQGQSLPEELRPEVWKACLGIKDSIKQITFDEIFDLPEQNILREDCQQFVGECFDLYSVLNFTRLGEVTLKRKWFTVTVTLS